ncbi:MAG: translation elongation factor Ts [Planctomycetes bacterium]|nr:translation elongation factor Ts [Planctomycetota bacterium]
MNVSAKDVKELRDRTGVGMMECKQALVEAGGDLDKALEYLRKSGAARVLKKAGREIKDGAIGSYVHHNGRVACLVELGCETDFVARSDDFRALLKNLCQQVAATAPLAVDASGLDPALLAKEREIYVEQVQAEGKPEGVAAKIVEGKLAKFRREVCLLEQPFIKDDQKQVKDLLQDAVQKLGENITVRRFVRYQFGE